ncbi:MAG: DUF4912 domain-containing protein, partial [Elusimicrobia bacterium]|nr:DUF4912 domain-containing protein [Elusimicrobiota bacterium]
SLSLAQERKVRDFLKNLKKRRAKTAMKKKNVKTATTRLKKPTSKIEKRKKTQKPPRKIFIDTGPALPEKYFSDRLILLPRDPSYVFAYWELNKEIKESPKLRIYEVEKGRDKFFFDVSVNKSANNWYVKVPHPDARYRAELGFVKGGKFYCLISSNSVLVPRAGISDEVDEEWMIVKEDLQNIIKATGLDKAARSSLVKAQIDTRTLLEQIKSRIPGSSSSFFRKIKK